MIQSLRENGTPAFMLYKRNIVISSRNSEANLGISFTTHIKSPRKKCPYLELFWSAFSRIRIEYREMVFSPNVGKWGPEYLPIQTLFTQLKAFKSKVNEPDVKVHFPQRKKWNFAWKIYSVNVIKLAQTALHNVLTKRYSENMQQIYRRTLMPKCEFGNTVFVALIASPLI